MGGVTKLAGVLHAADAGHMAEMRQMRQMVAATSVRPRLDEVDIAGRRGSPASQRATRDAIVYVQRPWSESGSRQADRTQMRLKPVLRAKLVARLAAACRFSFLTSQSSRASRRTERDVKTSTRGDEL